MSTEEVSDKEAPIQQAVSNARGCYSCDVASSKLRRSRTTFNKSLVNFTLIAASHIKLRKA